MLQDEPGHHDRGHSVPGTAVRMDDRYPAQIPTGQVRLCALPVARLGSAGRSGSSSPVHQGQLAIPPDSLELLRLSERRLDSLRVEPRGTRSSVWAIESLAIRCMVGYIGFLSDPRRLASAAQRDGSVDVDCAIATGFRRRGFGRDAVTGLLAWARDHHATRRVDTCLPEHDPASMAFAVALGFEVVEDDSVSRTGEVRMALAEHRVHELRNAPARRIVPYVIDF